MLRARVQYVEPVDRPCYRGAPVDRSGGTGRGFTILLLRREEPLSLDAPETFEIRRSAQH